VEQPEAIVKFSVSDKSRSRPGILLLKQSAGLDIPKEDGSLTHGKESGTTSTSQSIVVIVIMVMMFLMMFLVMLLIMFVVLIVLLMLHLIVMGLIMLVTAGRCVIVVIVVIIIVIVVIIILIYDTDRNASDIERYAGFRTASGPVPRIGHNGRNHSGSILHDLLHISRYHGSMEDDRRMVMVMMMAWRRRWHHDHGHLRAPSPRRHCRQTDLKSLVAGRKIQRLSRSHSRSKQDTCGKESEYLVVTHKDFAFVEL